MSGGGDHAKAASQPRPVEAGESFSDGWERLYRTLLLGSTEGGRRVESPGYVFAVGTCWSCGDVMTFNVGKVPSLPVDGVRQPICRACVERANPLREQNGLDPISYDDDAYEAGPLSDIGE